MKLRAKHFRRGFELALPSFLIVGFLLPLGTWFTSSFTLQFDPLVPVLAPQQLWITIKYSAASTAIAVVLGTALALYHRFLPPQKKVWFTYIVTVPLIVGFIARNFAWLAIFSFLEKLSATFLGHKIQVAYQPYTVIVVMTSAFIPLAFFVVSNGLRPLRNEQLEAAQLMGVPPDKLFRAIVLPIALRSATLAFLLILAIAIAYFVTPRMIGGGNVNFIGSTAIKFQNAGFPVFANQLGITLLAPALIVSVMLAVLIYRWRGRQLGF